MFISLLQTFGAFVTGVLVTLITQKGQARLSERVHSREMIRDTIAFQRQRVEKLRDWHAQQFDIALDAAKLYHHCLRRVHAPADINMEEIRDYRDKADRLMTDVIHSLRREGGNDYVIFRCQVVRLGFDCFDVRNELNDLKDSLTDESMDSDWLDVSLDEDTETMRKRIFSDISKLETAIQERLRELDIQMKELREVERN